VFISRMEAPVEPNSVLWVVHGWVDVSTQA